MSNVSEIFSDIKYLGKVKQFLQEIESKSEQESDLILKNTMLTKSVEEAELSLKKLKTATDEKLNEVHQKLKKKEEEVDQEKTKYTELYERSLRSFTEIKKTQKLEKEKILMEVELLRQKVNDGEREKAQLMESYGNLNKSFETINYKMGEVEKNIKQEREDIISELEKLEKQKSSLENKGHLKEEEIVKINDQKAALIHQLQEKEKEHSRLMGSYDELKKNYKEVKGRIVEVEDKAWSEKDKFLKEVQSLKIDKKVLEEKEKMKKSFENDLTSMMHKRTDDNFQEREFLNKNATDQERLNLIMQVENLKQKNKELKDKLDEISNFKHELKRDILDVFDDTTNKYLSTWQEIKTEWNLEIGKLHSAEIEIDKYSKARYGVGLFEEEKNSDEVIVTSEEISSTENKEEVGSEVLSSIKADVSLPEAGDDYQQFKDVILSILHDGEVADNMLVGVEELQKLKTYITDKNGRAGILDLLENSDADADDKVISYEFAEKEMKEFVSKFLQKSEVDEENVLEFDLESEKGIIGQLEGIKDSIKR